MTLWWDSLLWHACGTHQRPSDTLTKPVNTLLLLVLFITMVDAWNSTKNKWPIPMMKSTIIVLAPQRGLEPRTCWLTASRSTDWATGEHLSFVFPSPDDCQKIGLLKKNFSGYIIQEQTDVNNFNSLFSKITNIL